MPWTGQTRATCQVPWVDQVLDQVAKSHGSRAMVNQEPWSQCLRSDIEHGNVWEPSTWFRQGAQAKGRGSLRATDQGPQVQESCTHGSRATQAMGEGVRVKSGSNNKLKAHVWRVIKPWVKLFHLSMCLHKCFSVTKLQINGQAHRQWSFFFKNLDSCNYHMINGSN